MKISIRLVKAREFRELAELTNKAYTVPYKPGKLVTKANDSEGKIKEETRGGAKIFVAEFNNKIIGSARCKESDGVLFMYKLAVSGNFTKRGVGGQLINHIFKYGKKLGLNKAKIEVAEAKGLVPFYKSFGFKPIKRHLHKNHYEILMEKGL